MTSMELKEKEKDKVEQPPTYEESALLNEGVKKDPYAPPDGGWGWVVMVCAFFCTFTLDGICYVFGVFLDPLKKDFGVGDGAMSAVGSVLSGVIQLVGPFASLLANILGMRTATIIGAVVSAAGFFISTFVHDVYVLLLFFGIVAGTGLGLMYVPAVCSVGYWFDKKRAFATGVVTSGSGAGTFILAPLASFLLIQFSSKTTVEDGELSNTTVASITNSNLNSTLEVAEDQIEPSSWRGAMRVFSGLCLLCVICGLAFKPLPKKPKAKNEDDEDAEAQSESNCCRKILDESCSPKLLTNVPFMLLCFSNLFATQGLYIPYIFLPSLATGKGISEVNAAFLISIVGICNTTCRILSGMLTSLPGVSALVVTFITLGIGAIAPLAMPFCEDFWGFVVVSAMFGCFLSAWCALTPPAIVDMAGVDLLTSGFGTLTFVRGFAALVGPPLAGALVDATGNKDYAFYLSAALLLASSLICVVAWLAQKAIEKRRTT